MPGAGNPGAVSFRFRAHQRLKTSAEFEKIRREGQRLAKGCLILNWQTVPGRAYSRVGIITSRKVGGAPGRARARRLFRESFRLHQHELNAPADLVLVARPSIDRASFARVERDFLSALASAKLLRSP